MKKLLIALILAVSFFTLAGPVLAEGDFHIVPEGCRGQALLGTEPSWVDTGAGEYCGLSEIESMFLNVGRFILGIVGALTLLMFVYGGFMYIISPVAEKIQKGKDILIYAAVGLLIVLCAAVAMRYVQEALIGDALQTTQQIPGGSSGTQQSPEQSKSDYQICVENAQQDNKCEAMSPGSAAQQTCQETRAKALADCAKKFK